MNKTELVKSISQQIGVDHNMLEALFGRTFATIEAALVEGEQVSIAGFGTFTMKTRRARQGRNPRTGEPIDIPESRTVGFKPAKAFKERINQ